MKKIIAILILSAFILSFTACKPDLGDRSDESSVDISGESSNALESSETSDESVEISEGVSEDVSVDTSVDVSEDAGVDTSEDVSEDVNEDEPDVDIDSGSESELRTLQSVFPSRAATGYSTSAFS